MRDITRIIQGLEHIYANKYCKVNNVDLCPTPHECQCKMAAEITAYLQTIIPEPYYNFSIRDFTGQTKDFEKILKSEIVKNAKDKLLKYCWKNVDLEKSQTIIDEELSKLSIIDIRRQMGTNVVIYSDENDRNRGKTFIASLVMKEAILRRAFPGHRTQTYDWIQFPVLQKMLIDDNPEAVSMKCCDWLVIDDIPHNPAISGPQRAFLSSFLDPFLFARMEDKLPTILVFRFNAYNKAENISEQLGVAMEKITKDNMTFKISLCE